MRVVVTHTDLRLYWGARLRALHAELTGTGHDLLVLEIAGAGSPYAFAGSDRAAVPWWRCLFPRRRMEDIKPSEARSALWAALDQAQPDVVVAGALAFPSGASALAWCRRHDRGFVVMDNARRIDVPRSSLTNFVKRRLHSLADAALLPSPRWRSDYEAWGVKAERQFYGLNSIEVDFFESRARAAAVSDTELRAELGLPVRFFLGVGRQVEKKNWAALVRAYGRYRQAPGSEAWALVLVGDGPERASLEALAAAGVPEVKFMGFLDAARLAQVYGLAGGLVLPSLSGETWGNVVSEAMAVGLPVIVSNACGCASTLVEAGRSGWTFDPTDEAKLAELLMTVTRLDSQDRAKMGEGARRSVGAWGTDRFVAGAIQAIRCGSTRPHLKGSLLDRALTSLWRGRYLPT